MSRMGVRGYRRLNGWRVSIPLLAMMLPLLLSSLADIPGYVDIGPVTLMGFLTLLYLYLGLIALICSRWNARPLWRFLVPYTGFLATAGLGWAFGAAAAEGLQNLAVYVAFPVFVALGYLQALRRPERLFRLLGKTMSVYWWTTLPLVAMNLLFFGFGSGIVGSNWSLGPRSVAFVALFPFSWYLARWRSGHKRALIAALVWLVVIFVSLSRTALVIAILLLMLIQFRATWRGWVRFVVAGTAAVGAFLFALGRFEPLSSRFFQGDTSLRLFGIPINGSGRVAIWSRTLQSISEAPVFGQGTGSVEQMLRATFGGISHPHNDYLRLWHDVGAVGLTLFLLAVVAIVLPIAKAWLSNRRGDSPDSTLVATGFLTAVGFLAGMFTDNVLVYAFYVCPACGLLGAALATAHRHKGAVVT